MEHSYILNCTKSIPYKSLIKFYFMFVEERSVLLLICVRLMVYFLVVDVASQYFKLIHVQAERAVTRLPGKIGE